MTAAARVQRSHVVPLRAAPDATAAYRAAVIDQCGPVDEGEIAVRSELCRVRDRASAALSRCCEDAEPALQEAHRLAGLTAFATLPPAVLALTLMAADGMIQAANLIQKASKL